MLKIVQITALNRFWREELTLKDAKIMKILSPEWSLIARWDLALKLLEKHFVH